MGAVGRAKFMMKLREVAPPSPDISVGELSEVFGHPVFREGSAETRKSMMMKSSESKYRSELEYPWDVYFGCDLRHFLEGKEALDLGSFTGGRSLAWYERYHLAKMTGIDVDQVFVDAAGQFARLRKANAEFFLAKGEGLPFPDESFDAVLSYDVFEHVQDLGKTLAEVHRVLRTGGRLFTVFPGYFQPLEHHLTLVTATPGLQYLFSGRTLLKAYMEILSERGADASWYGGRSPVLEPWERGNTINGTTLAGFRRLIPRNSWKVVRFSRKAIGSIGRNAAKHPMLQAISVAFVPLVYVPGLRECLLHRITYILEKTH